MAICDSIWELKHIIYTIHRGTDIYANKAISIQWPGMKVRFPWTKIAIMCTWTCVRLLLKNWTENYLSSAVSSSRAGLDFPIEWKQKCLCNCQIQFLQKQKSWRLHAGLKGKQALNHRLKDKYKRYIPDNYVHLLLVDFSPNMSPITVTKRSETRRVWIHPFSTDNSIFWWIWVCQGTILSNKNKVIMKFIHTYTNLNNHVEEIFQYFSSFPLDEEKKNFQWICSQYCVELPIQ